MIKNNKNEKGITIIALIVSVIVLLIISGVSISLFISSGIVDKTKDAAFSNKISTYNEEFNTYLVEKYAEDLRNFERYELNAKNISKEENGVLPLTNIMPSMAGDTYCLERIEIVEGEFVFTDFSEQEIAIIKNIFQHGQIASKPDGGIKNEYFQENVNPPIIPSENEILSTEEHKGICAVTFSDSGEKIIQTNLKEQWYNYKAQTGSTSAGGDSKWANIETKDGSLWVWVPRFAYKITNGAHVRINYTDTNQLANGEGGKIEVKFLKGTTNEFWDGTNEEIVTNPDLLTYTGTSQNEWFLPPAFKFGDQDLEGFWIAKYEASSVEGNGENIATDNVLNIKTLQVKSGFSSWRNIEPNTMFGNIILMGTEHSEHYGFAPKTNTHLTKNIEWGAVAYLAHSQYGRNGDKIAVNTSTDYITGTGGVLASTTGNAYGIYDMAGGGSDAVAAVTDLSKIDLKFLNASDVAEYIDIYKTYNSSQKGDAIYETSIKFSGTTSWFTTLSWLVNDTESRMSRGGSSLDGNNAGIFSFYRYADLWYHINKVSFRPVITPGIIQNENIIK